ncbi:MAG: ABC transporter substrate-binding protein [Clostridiales bacterium]|jgi:putative aldouronate transport system substrate-binding protein|nr:ABC transporter substrate-binding protein [Clostridiales bacterium]
MKKSVKLVLPAVLAIVMLAAGCSPKASTNSPAAAASNSPAASQSEAAATAAEIETSANNEVVTVKWEQLGDKPANYDTWISELNDYIGPQYGINADVDFISNADYANRSSVIVQSGEYFDMIYTNTSNYVPNVRMGAYMDISDLAKTAAPDLYKYIPEDIWEASTVDGKIYGVPTYKDCAATLVMVWDRDLTDQAGLNINDYTTFTSIVEPLTKIKDETGQPSLIVDDGGVSGLINPIYDDMGTALTAVGVRYDDTSRTAGFTLEQPDVMAGLKAIREMYQSGVINADAPTIHETPDKKPFFIAQGWVSAAKTIWGPNGDYNAEAVVMGDPIINNSTVRGSINAVYSGSKYPEQALQMLQVANLDVKVRDMFYYGLEGENFNYTADNKVEKLSTDWQVAAYAQATFFTVTPLADVEINQWDEIKELNEIAQAGTLLGFSFDTSSIETELANCRDIMSKYKAELMTGAIDPEETVAQIKAEMENVGLNNILEEAQKQIDAANFS